MIRPVPLSRPLDARQLRTRAALKAAVLKLTANKPFAGISVGEIAETAQVGPATFYRHYRDKNALLADVAEGFVAELTPKITPVVLATDSGAAALALCRFVEERREVCVALLAGGAGNAVREKILERAIEQSRRSGISETLWLPGDLGSLHIVTSLLNVLGWWLGHDREIGAEEMSAIIDRLVLKPVLGGGA